ncbi:hypothetical protein KVF89_01935 [Nocardioides carbamazepini]|uniref:ABC transporter substrate-binding protein n=1 Tax=Nocardioides carbamazepini TaxID=2854259 RepID=UPI00214A6758|nr:ABC transporter substrate-binding protein [Nocardioides carbamazepini]MCR1781281.1 hypothetical protein [Nocardioides carbamazepini]
MRSRLLTVLTFLCIATTTACGGADGSTDSTPDPDGTITVLDVNPQPNGTMDPRTAKNDSGPSQSPLYAVFDRLIGFDEEGTPIPQLATEWSYSDDLTVVTLTLREGVTFHDGTAFDATAVKENLEAAKTLDADVGSTFRAAAAQIASVEATSPTEVAITLTAPDGGFIYALGTQIGMMISPAALGRRGLEMDPVGTGPFVLEEFTPNESTSMVRYDDYWDGVKDRPKRLVMKYVTDETTRLNAVRSGEATVASVTPQQIATAEGAGLEVKINPSGSRWTMYLNTSGALGEPLVRQALMYAIDRKSIAAALGFGTTEPTVQLIPKGQPGHIDGAEDDYAFDPDKARELLEQAGYPDGLTLGFLLLNLSDYTQMFDVVSQQLKDVGITLDVKTMDISQSLPAFQDGSGGDIWMVRWGGRADPLQTLEIVVGPGGTYTPGGVVSEDLADALEAVSGFSVDDPARAEAIEEANRITIESAATVPIIDRPIIYAYKKGCVSGLEPYLASSANDWRDVTVGVGCS